MSYATIRAMFESAIVAAYQALPVPVPVCFDNVQETPSDGEHVILSISFPGTAEGTVCGLGEGLIEYVRGSIQVSCYAPRAQGMKRVEQLAQVAATALAQLYLRPDPDNVRPRVSNIQGPTNVLSGQQPYALAVVSAAFTGKG